MNWISKVALGMLLFATLLIALGVMFIRANEYLPTTIKVDQNVKTNIDTNIKAQTPVLLTAPATSATPAAPATSATPASGTVQKK